MRLCGVCCSAGRGNKLSGVAQRTDGLGIVSVNAPGIFTVESVEAERRVAELVSDGVRRIEEIVTGKVRGLSEEEYRKSV